MPYTNRLPVSGPGLDGFTFPAENALMVVGDSHGQSAPLRETLDLMGRMVTPGKKRTLVFLGDFIDRGPDSMGCLEAAILEGQDRAQADEVVFLPGNHELMLADVFDRLYEDTLNEGDDAMLWMMNGGMEFLMEVTNDDLGNPVDALKKLDDDLRAKNIAFRDLVRAWPASFTMGHTLCIHAGVNPKTIPDCLALPQKGHRVAGNHWAWVRKDFLEWQRGFPIDHNDGYLVIHGHTTPKGARSHKFEHGDAVNDIFNRMETNARICVDGGAASGVGVAGTVQTEDGVRILFTPC